MYLELLDMVKKLGISCPYCSLQFTNISDIIYKSDSYGSPTARSPLISFRSAFLFRLKLQILFSEALPLFGTIIAKALTGADSPASMKIFDTFSKMKTTAHPPELVTLKKFSKFFTTILFG